MKFPLTCLALWFFGLGAEVNAAENPKILIWKFDDVRAGERARLAQGFKRVAEWAADTKTVITMGVICNSLVNPNAEDVAWIKKNAVENGGRVEFWLHGWDHLKLKKADGTDGSEFNGSDLITQTKHFKEACEIFKKNTGLSFSTFGAPYNQSDENTSQAMNACPELKNWFFGPLDKTHRVLARTVNMEIATGKVSYDKFIQAYQTKPIVGPLVLQGHVGLWDDSSYNDFIKIADFLRKEGWITQTVSQWANPTKNK